MSKRIPLNSSTNQKSDRLFTAIALYLHFTPTQRGSFKWYTPQLKP
ncbi:MAG: hypothetical protein KME15_20580 [Drouetiella hepatica Uher 2000/2452]|uniref:Uncharacterized protein n=1 Tax=Drouetiella hepatica Uher 2000/2452 TaxID=904376 RepID=A0A951QE60_9CYAN|nr:hypothetical protein [Drouetiella hepatica Uher 2000/2452]